MLLFGNKLVREYCVDDINFKGYQPRYCDGGYETLKDSYVTGSGFYWFSKKIIDDNGIHFRPDVYYSDDTLFMAKYKPHVRRMAVTDAPIYYYFQRDDSVSHAVKNGLHCSCMYKLAKEYRELGKGELDTCYDRNFVKRMKNAQTRAMQACISDLCLYCDDKEIVKDILKKAKNEKLYPFGVVIKQFRIDRKQSRKLDLMNWVFGFISFEPYFWLLYFLMKPIRARKKTNDFNLGNFEDNY